jgi:hypothetical protein
LRQWRGVQRWHTTTPSPRDAADRMLLLWPAAEEEATLPIEDDDDVA